MSDSPARVIALGGLFIFTVPLRPVAHQAVQHVVDQLFISNNHFTVSLKPGAPAEMQVKAIWNILWTVGMVTEMQMPEPITGDPVRML